MIKIGDKFLKHDPNKRVYRDPKTGEQSRTPIFKYSFREFFVIGETSRSWVLARNRDTKPDSNRVVKLPKKTLPVEYGYLTEQQVQDTIYVNTNRYEAAETIQRFRVQDAEKLRKIMEILND